MRLIGLAVVLALAAACQQSGSTAPPAATATSSSTNELTKKIDELDTEIFALRGRVASLESESAEISTAGEGYGIARTKFGPFTVVSRGITPHLDGYKVKLAVGNFTSAAFHGAKVKVEWGPPYEKGKFAEYLKNRKEQEVNVTTSFYPGAYSVVEITLIPAKAEEVRTLRVGLEFNVLSLR
jgi:hypothetical protein